MCKKNKKGFKVRNNRNISLLFINNNRFRTRYSPADKVSDIDFNITQNIINVSEDIGGITKCRSSYIYFFILWR